MYQAYLIAIVEYEAELVSSGKDRLNLGVKILTACVLKS